MGQREPMSPDAHDARTCGCAYFAHEELGPDILTPQPLSPQPVQPQHEPAPSDSPRRGVPVSGDARLAWLVGRLGECLDEVVGERGGGVDVADLSGAGLGEVLVGLLRVRRRVEGLAAVVAGRFEHGPEWAGSGARDAQAWLRGQGNEGVVSVRGVFTGARISGGFGVVAGAWQAGDIGAAHVGVIDRVAGMFPRLVGHLQAAQVELVELAREREPADFARALTGMCHRLDPLAAEQDARDRRRGYFLRASRILDGAVRVDGLLPADVGALLIASLEAARAQATDQADTTTDEASDTGDRDTDPRDSGDRAAGDRAAGARDAGARDAGARDAGARDAGGVGGGVDVFGNPIRPGDFASQDAYDSRVAGQANVEALHRILTSASPHLPTVGGARPVIHITVDADTLTRPTSTDTGTHTGTDTGTVTGTDTGTGDPARGGAVGGGQGSGGGAWLDRFGVPTFPLTAQTARRLACDATVRPLILDAHGQLTAYGTATRTIPPGMRALVTRRDRHCRFAGCRARIDEIHHVVFYSRGGPTRPDNLLGLCWHHHHLVHHDHWTLTGNANHHITATGPHHHTWTTRPPPT